MSTTRYSNVATVTINSNPSKKYTLYFQSLIDELREQHNFTGARKVEGRHFHPFDSGHRIRCLLCRRFS